jgi:hypothetical protein
MMKEDDRKASGAGKRGDEEPPLSPPTKRSIFKAIFFSSKKETKKEEAKGEVTERDAADKEGDDDKLDSGARTDPSLVSRTISLGMDDEKNGNYDDNNVMADESQQGLEAMEKGKEKDDDDESSGDDSSNEEVEDEEDEGDYSEYSDSESSLDSAEVLERALRRNFLYTAYHYIGCGIFAKLMEPAMQYIQPILNFLLKCLKKLQGNDDQPGAEDLAQEAMDGANPMQTQFGGFTGGGPAPTGPMPTGPMPTGPMPTAPMPGPMPGPIPTGPMPVGPIGPPPGVAEMAASAAQSAASASASGAATASAGAAGAASSSAAAGMAGAVASSGVAGQVGAAVGVAAVAAAAVSTGVSLTGSNDTIPYIDDFIPPVCSSTALLKEGYVEFKIQALPLQALPGRRFDLEELFRDVYNGITGQFPCICIGVHFLCLTGLLIYYLFFRYVLGSVYPSYAQSTS